MASFQVEIERRKTSFASFSKSEHENLEKKKEKMGEREKSLKNGSGGRND